MDHLIYTAMSGASAAAQRQSVLANNLANASTQGFRAELSTFRAVPLRGDGATTRVFAMEATSGHDEKAGAMQRTGRTLDMAAQGNSWFAVQGLDGTEAYTRAGAFQVSSEGTLVTSSNLPVLSDGGAPIDVPQGAQIAIGTDGTVTSKTDGQPGATLDPLPNDTTARMETGVLEGSNVNPVETMVGMIAAARQFEQQMRLLQTAETSDKSAAQLLSVG